MTTAKHRDGTNYFMLEPTCQHVREFAAPIGAVTDSLRSLYEARWDAQAEELFKRHTANWTEGQRERYRAQIFPAPKPVEDTSYVANCPWRKRHD